MKKILLTLSFIAMYLSITELNAKQKAEHFCASVLIGNQTQDLLDRAVDAGARPSGSGWHEPRDGDRQLIAVFTGFAPGSDFLCIVVAKDGSVKDKKLRQSSLLKRLRS